MDCKGPLTDKEPLELWSEVDKMAATITGLSPTTNLPPATGLPQFVDAFDFNETVDWNSSQPEDQTADTSFLTSLRACDERMS